jgi:hypothetical protein
MMSPTVPVTYAFLGNVVGNAKVIEKKNNLDILLLYNIYLILINDG